MTTKCRRDRRRLTLCAVVGYLLMLPASSEAFDPAFLPVQRLDVNSLRSPKLRARVPSAEDLEKWQAEYAEKKAQCGQHFAACFQGWAANSPMKPSPYFNNVYASDVNECAAAQDYDMCHGVRVCDADGEQLGSLFTLYPPYMDNTQTPPPRVYGPVSCKMTGAKDNPTQLDFLLQTVLKCNPKAYPSTPTAGTIITYGASLPPKYYSCIDGDPAQLSTDNEISKIFSTYLSTTDFLTFIKTVKQAFLDAGQTPPPYMYEESNYSAKVLNTYRACLLSFKYANETKVYAMGAVPCEKPIIETPVCIAKLSDGKKLCIAKMELINNSVECTDFSVSLGKTIPAYTGPNPDQCKVSFVVQ